MYFLILFMFNKVEKTSISFENYKVFGNLI